MSSIDKMLIMGIRSFSPQSQQGGVIEFGKPLTVITGHNGAGKTVSFVIMLYNKLIKNVLCKTKIACLSTEVWDKRNVQSDCATFINQPLACFRSYPYIYASSYTRTSSCIPMPGWHRVYIYGWSAIRRSRFNMLFEDSAYRGAVTILNCLHFMIKHQFLIPDVEPMTRLHFNDLCNRAYALLWSCHCRQSLNA